MSELNLSVSDTDKLGTKVEVKNINSFKAVERAAEYETKRHIELLEEGKGNEIVQETRGWDETKQKTFFQRSKKKILKTIDISQNQIYRKCIYTKFLIWRI